MGLLGKEVPPPTKRIIPSRLPRFRLPAYIPTEELVGCWLPFVGEGDSLEDCSGTGNDGTINGATWVYSPGQGWVLDYDGSDYVEVPDDPSLEPNTLTVSAWVNLDSLVDWENFVSKWGSGGNQYNLQLDGVDNSITFVVQNAAGTSYRADSGVVPSTGEWYHAVGTWNGTDVSIYVNGTLEASVSLSGDLNSGTESVYFGAEDGAATIRLDGTTGGVLIYARALSDGEIANIYEKTKPLYVG